VNNVCVCVCVCVPVHARACVCVSVCGVGVGVVWVCVRKFTVWSSPAPGLVHSSLRSTIALYKAMGSFVVFGKDLKPCMVVNGLPVCVNCVCGCQFETGVCCTIKDVLVVAARHLEEVPGG
jgi:hypothetical protein